MTASTVVFDITLPEEDCKEFSYLELYQDHLAGTKTAVNSSDPFAHLDAASASQLSDIAKSFEKKYGTMVTFKKGGTQQRVRIDDYLDPGDGYDTTDSFIDDSEAADLYVAPNVSTKFGGFFVCEGTVEGMEDQNIKIDSFWGLKPHNNVSTPTHAMKKAKSKALLDRAVKRLSTPVNVKRKPTALPTPAATSAALSDDGAVNFNGNRMTNLDDVFDAVLSAANSTGNTISTVSASQATKEADISKYPSDSELVHALPDAKPVSSPKPQQAQQSPTPLPPNLPDDILTIISRIVTMAQPNAGNQRRVLSKAFDSELLGLSTALNVTKVSHSVRAAVFAHTEDRMQWKRKSLTRRLKKLTVATEDQKMNPLLDALGDAITNAMPPILEAYARDKESYVERMKVWQAEVRAESLSAEANGITTATAAGTVDGQTTKRPPKPGPPKKLFRWNEECRTIFRSIVKGRLESHQTLNLKVSREEYLRGLFPTLMQLWPDGWITNAALKRAALPAFHNFNNSSPVASATTTTGAVTAANTNSTGFRQPGGNTGSTSVSLTSQQQTEMSQQSRSPLSASIVRLTPLSSPPGTLTCQTTCSSVQPKSPVTPLSTAAAAPARSLVVSSTTISGVAPRPPALMANLEPRPTTVVPNSCHLHPPPPVPRRMTTSVAPATINTNAVAVGDGALTVTAGGSVDPKHLVYNTAARAAALIVTNSLAPTAAGATVTNSSPFRQSSSTKVGNANLSASLAQAGTNRRTTNAMITSVPQRVTPTAHSTARPNISAGAVVHTTPAATVAAAHNSPLSASPAAAVSTVSTSTLANIISTVQLNQLQQKAAALAQLAAVTCGVTATHPSAGTAVRSSPPAPQQQHMCQPPPAHQNDYPRHTHLLHQAQLQQRHLHHQQQQQQQLLLHKQHAQQRQLQPARPQIQPRQQLQPSQLQQQQQQPQLVGLLNGSQSGSGLPLTTANPLLHAHHINANKNQQC